MRIGVDCDGVLTDMSAYIWQFGEKYFKRKPSNLAGYSTREIFGCSEKEDIRFGLKYFFTYCRTWPPRPGAAEAVNGLRSQGHQLYEITARMFVTRKNPLGWYSRRLLLNWIGRHGFQFDDIYLCAEEHTLRDKLAGCRKYGVELMIDDKPDVALHLASHGVKVLLFDTAYNREVRRDDIIRVHDWEEIRQVIQHMADATSNHKEASDYGKE